MRRLATQTRNDSYASNKDYQHTHEKISQKFCFSGDSLIFHKEVHAEIKETLVGFGGFLFPEENTHMTLGIFIGDVELHSETQLINNWNRVGLSFTLPHPGNFNIEFRLTFSRPSNISIWGLDADSLFLPDKALESITDTNELNASHLAPETYYLPHQQSINLKLVDDKNIINITNGRPITLKKCSFCQRDLPIRTDHLGALSFHKHNAKLTKHQNECRSCKKWRINNEFNPLRTTDQLHESSVITRERKILLKEPQILQDIKKRTGAGLKSQIWEKFNKRCFYCNTPVELDEFQLDHTRPLAYLWPIDEHATCLCPKHNNQKKDKFPIDFYNEEQLHRLSSITGLSYEELSIKAINEPELNRILKDIVRFSTEWDSRTFFAISRKILELSPEIDLCEILKKKSKDAYDQLTADLNDRPAPVLE